MADDRQLGLFPRAPAIERPPSLIECIAVIREIRTWRYGADWPPHLRPVAQAGLALHEHLMRAATSPGRNL
jgi:hypothetical protein